MITNLKTTGFMGPDLDESIGPKMIYTGENTSGKSKRSKAIAFCLLGFIPFSAKTIKTGADILRDYGNGKAMSTGVTCNGKTFERILRKSKNGAVKKAHKIDGMSASKANFERGLMMSGDPRIIDLNHFVSLSDNAKIDALFALYPPDGDVSTINADIVASKDEISRLTKEKGKADNTILTLIESKNSIDLPAGSLAETQAEIKKLTDDVNSAREELKKEEVGIAKEKAIKAEKERAEKEKSAIPKEQPQTDIPTGNTVGYSPSVTKQNVKTNWNIDCSEMARKSIQRIIDVMHDAGCQTCTAVLVAKSELKKFK